MTDDELQALGHLMVPESALRYRILGLPSIAALVGDRCYPAPLVQGDPDNPDEAILPAITMQEVVRDGDQNLDGPAGSARTTVQVDVWAKTSSVATRLKELVRVQVDGKAWESSPMRVFVATIVRIAGAPTYEPETRLHRRSFDVLMFHTEARTEQELE